MIKEIAEYHPFILLNPLSSKHLSVLCPRRLTKMDHIQNFLCPLALVGFGQWEICS